MCCVIITCMVYLITLAYSASGISRMLSNLIYGDDYSFPLLKYSIKFHSCVPRASDFYRKCIIDNSWTATRNWHGDSYVDDDAYNISCIMCEHFHLLHTRMLQKYFFFLESCLNDPIKFIRLSVCIKRFRRISKCLSICFIKRPRIYASCALTYNLNRYSLVGFNRLYSTVLFLLRSYLKVFSFFFCSL